jgi:hypothetical protein
MKFIYLLFIIFYLWFGYKLLNIKTFGYTNYKISILILSFSLFISSLITLWYSNIYYMLIPVIPFIFVMYTKNKIKKIKCTKNKIYFKNK